MLRYLVQLIVLPSFFILGLIPGEKDSIVQSTGIHQNQISYLDQVSEIAKGNIVVSWLDVFIWGVFVSNVYAISFLGPSTCFECTVNLHESNNTCKQDIIWLVVYATLSVVNGIVLMVRNRNFLNQARVTTMLKILTCILFVTTIGYTLGEYV